MNDNEAAEARARLEKYDKGIAELKQLNNIQVHMESQLSSDTWKHNNVVHLAFSRSPVNGREGDPKDFSSFVSYNTQYFFTDYELYNEFILPRLKKRRAEIKEVLNKL